jgi:hypothetical protein
LRTPPPDGGKWLGHTAQGQAIIMPVTGRVKGYF